MSGIAHLAKDNKTRPARIDSMDTDSVNSIIERISGVNPTKLAEGVKGGAQSSPGPQMASAPPSPITQNFQPQHQQYGIDPEKQQMMQRMQMLEQKVALYERGSGDPAFSFDHGPSNRGPESRVWRRDMDPKKVNKPDVADGEPDSKKKAKPPEEQAMAGEQTNILGISMTEWRDLAGITTPYVDLTSGKVPQHVLAESQEEYTEDYFTEDELTEAWVTFISSKGFDPGEFSKFAEDAEDMGDEDALIAIQSLEDEFQEMIDAYLESSSPDSVEKFLQRGGQITKGKTKKAKGYMGMSSKYTRMRGQKDKAGHRLPANVKREDIELTCEDVEDIWGAWLETRGLSVEMFNYLIDEAIATDDTDEMDALLAVEDLFNKFINEADMEVLKGLRSRSGQDATAWIKGLGKNKAPTRGQEVAAAPAKKEKPGAGVMVSRGGLKTASVESNGFPSFNRSRQDEGAPVPKDDPVHKEIGSMRSIVPKSMKKLLAKGKKSDAAAAPAASKEDPRKWAKSWDLADSISYEEDGLSFECDCDDKGEPNIPWARILKKMKNKGKKSASEGSY